MRIELHSHTTASDGQHAPADLVRLARGLGLTLLAITDHDTTNGIAPAREAARGNPIILPGIELSAEDEVEGDVHMLGYGLNPDAPLLQAALADFRERRVRRAQEMVEKLATLGAPVEWARVEALAAGGSVGRPHVARALMAAGHVESVPDAFDRYLHNGGPAYVPRKRLSPEDAITLIHRAGGAAVLAHPGLLAHWPRVLERLVPAGLDGVEVNHPKNDEATRLNLRGMAPRLGLIMTGGSDFHGHAISDSQLGAFQPPAGAVEALRERAAEWARKNH